MDLTRRELAAAFAAILAAAFVAPAASARSDGMKHVSLETVVGTDVYRAAGLHKLTFAEQEALKEWIEEYSLHIVKSVQDDCFSGRLKKKPQ